MAKTEKKLMVTKAVKIPLVVTVTGHAADLKGEIGSMLTERLIGKLPMKFRLGRGRKETISIAVKAPKA